MRYTRTTRAVLLVCLFFAGTLLLRVFPCGSALAQDVGSHHILILHSYHPGMGWVENIERGMLDNLLLPPYQNVIIHTEHMDTKRNYSDEYYDWLMRIYREKYRNVALDLILATDNNAFDFLLKHRAELFHDAPMVFGGVNDYSPDSIAGYTDITGVAEVISFRETVDMILHQFPDTKQIYVINDYLKTGRAWHTNILRDQKTYEGAVRFLHNPNLTFNALRDTIQAMKPVTVILLGAYFADSTGQYLTYDKFAAMLASHSPVQPSGKSHRRQSCRQLSARPIDEYTGPTHTRWGKGRKYSGH